MKHYVGLDVSQEETHICVIDEDDRKIWQGKCLSTPETIGKLIKGSKRTKVQKRP